MAARAARARPENVVRVQQRHERIEVASTGGGQERLHDLAAAGLVGVGNGRGALDPAAGPAGQLPGRGRGTVDDRGDLLERHAEQVVQHERHAFGGAERLQRHQQGQADRVAQHCFLLRVRAVIGDRRVGDQRRVHRFLTPRPARAQHVQAHSRDHGGQPSAQVLDAARPGAAQANPGLLHRVVGLARRAEDPVGHAPHVSPVFLEPFGQPVVFVHRSPSPSRSLMVVTDETRPM